MTLYLRKPVELYLHHPGQYLTWDIYDLNVADGEEIYLNTIHQVNIKSKLLQYFKHTKYYLSIIFGFNIVLKTYFRYVRTMKVQQGPEHPRNAHIKITTNTMNVRITKRANY